VRKEVDNTRKDLLATVADLDKKLEREHYGIELLRNAGQHTDFDFVLNAKGAKTTLRRHYRTPGFKCEEKPVQPVPHYWHHTVSTEKSLARRAHFFLSS
jgi:hypothetical protein